MRLNTSPCLSFLIGSILLLSLAGYYVNHSFYHFLGNNYFPDNPLLLASLLLLNYWGFILTYGKERLITKSVKELLYFLGIMSLIALATNVVQLTPFEAIDQSIVNFESWLGINTAAILEWTAAHSYFKTLLGIIYDSLPYQMSFLPVMIIFLGRFNLIRDYYFLLLFTTLIGFCIYYFFPTMAPASIINSPLFSNEEIATGLKFLQIHHHQLATTNEGGLIAMPSFHTIWALLCVYLLKEWTIACLLLLCINLLLISSCVLLGWHYCSDVVAGIILLAVAFYCLKLCKR